MTLTPLIIRLSIRRLIPPLASAAEARAATTVEQEDSEVAKRVFTMTGTWTHVSSGFPISDSLGRNETRRSRNFFSNRNLVDIQVVFTNIIPSDEIAETGIQII